MTINDAAKQQITMNFYSFINFFTSTPFSVLTSTIYTPPGNAEIISISNIQYRTPNFQVTSYFIIGH